MNNYVATAEMSSHGLAITWESSYPSQMQTASILDFIESLRAVAVRTPSGQVSAAVEHMDQAAAYCRGERTAISVDRVGTWTCYALAPLPNVEHARNALHQDWGPMPLASVPAQMFDSANGFNSGVALDHPSDGGVVSEGSENRATGTDPREEDPAKRIGIVPTPSDSTSALPRRRAEVGTQLYADQSVPEEPEGGWRGLLAKFGIRVKPSPAELSRREDARALAQHWPGLRTVLVASPKGAANKTPTTALLSAAFARRGGAGVVAYDNNETRGTLPWRTEKGPHEATVLDLLPHVDDLMSASAQAADMARFLHHQSADHYNVLWSDQSVDSNHKISGDEFNAVHSVLGKYYRLLFIDSGNGERDDNFMAAVAKADQLVVPVVESKDVVEGAERMLDRFHGQGGHAERLAQNAVAIVSQRSKRTSVDLAVKTMQPRVKDLVVVPFDQSLRDGMIWFDALTPASQQAWEHAAAVVARNL